MLANGMLFPGSMPQSDHGGPGYCILAIDDDEVCLAFVTMMLEDQGYRVLTAATPHQAIWIYEDKWREIDVVLLDFLLPPFTGDFVFDELQRLNPDVRVVLLTGCDEAVAVEMSQKGLRGYLQKPFKAPDVARKVQEAMLSRQPRGGTPMASNGGAVRKTGEHVSSAPRDSDLQTGLSSLLEQDESSW